MRLLIGDDDIDVVSAAQTVIGHRQQAVGIRRQVYARDTRALVGDDIEEPGVLMRKAVVVLPPYGGSNQQVERSNIRAPVQLATFFQPFGVLVEHRIDDMNESFI